MEGQQQGNTGASAELLEEMLKHSDVEFFPQLRKRLDRFVDVFNHDRMQRALSDHRIEVVRLLENLEQASSVRSIVLGVREVIDHVKNLGVNSFVDSLCRSGFEGLLSCEALNFLDDDDLTLEQRVSRLIELHATQAPRWGQGPETTALACELVADIRQFCQPLRAKLAPLTISNAWTLGLSSLIGKVGARVNNSLGKLRRGRSQWYDETAQYIIDFVLHRHDGNLKQFLDDECLEDDLQHILACIRQWTRQVRRTLLPRDGKLLIEKAVAMAELERSRTFLYAVALNKPQMLQEHRESVTWVVRSAAIHPNPADAYLLPCVSYGQLPLPTSAMSSVLFSFVLDVCSSQKDAEDLLEETARIFKRVLSKTVEAQNNIRLLKLTVEISGSVPHRVAAIVSKLATLKVRGVLIGNLGHSEFRHAMNPTFNRIYSKDRQVRAEGFIPTWFPQSLGRGEEPYYCPIGWRRYAIDVGISSLQFEREYGQWPVAYHGTTGTLAMAILMHGLRASGQGCFLLRNQGAIFLSPSIEYCGHPHHANVVQIQSKYVQMVLQVRVHSQLIEKHPGTLMGSTLNDPGRADPNFKNDELEWQVKWKPESHVKALNGILVYGLMFRVTEDHPKTLPQNKWWANLDGLTTN